MRVQSQNRATKNDINMNEEKVFSALRDPRWDWRTLQGLTKSTNLRASLILEILLAHPSEVDFVVSRQYGLVFGSKNRKRTVDLPSLEKALDYVSFGRRSRFM